MSWVRIDGALVIIGVICSLLGLPAVAIALTAIALILLFCEFLMYWEFYDFLFPKKMSHNTAGIRKASGEAKQTGEDA